MNARAFGAAAGLLIGVMLQVGTAQAQATRTWVSGVGDDVNPCSYTAPCKTFAGAISKTAAGGEINVINAGAYGTVTITKSISIIAEGPTAGVLHSATNGINVNVPGGRVVLRGLDINGGTPSAPGLNGIRVIAADHVIIDKCVIRNSTGDPGIGINVVSTNGTQVVVTNSLISNNNRGINVEPITGVNEVLIDNTLIANNNGPGIRAAKAGGRVSVNNSRVVDNLTAVQIVGAAQVISYRNNVYDDLTAEITPQVLR
jgi:hypothetical protein